MVTGGTLFEELGFYYIGPVVRTTTSRHHSRRHALLGSV